MMPRQVFGAVNKEEQNILRSRRIIVYSVNGNGDNYNEENSNYHDISQNANLQLDIHTRASTFIHRH